MAGRVVVSTLNNDTGVLATQNGMTGIAKAWVSFNGTTTATVRSSFNISSVTRTGTGQYTVSFTTNMPDGNYAISGITTSQAGDTTNALVQLNTQSVNPSASSFQIYTVLGNQSVVDRTYIYLIVHSS